MLFRGKKMFFPFVYNFQSKLIISNRSHDDLKHRLCPKKNYLCPNNAIKYKNSYFVGMMEKLIPLVPFILLMVLILFLGLKKRNASNKFHMDYILLHLVVLLIMTLIYFGMINSIISYAYFNLLNQMHVASIILFCLHVESAIKGYRVKVKKIFYFYLLLYLSIVFLNELGIQIINVESKVKTFMLIEIKNAHYYTDKIVIKGITLILLISYLMKMCYSSIDNSFSVKRKHIYKIWVYSYSAFVITQLIINNMYYFGGFNESYNDTINIIIRINSIITLLFIFTNPTILYYLPLIKKINVFNKISKENYFHLLQIVMKKEKLYLIKKLNIKVLAIQVGISVKKLRLTILINTGKTFNEFINDYRVERAQKLILSGFLKRHTTIALAEKCGFNSHQTFFRAFRKKTNVTPKIYLENLDNK